MRSVYILLLLVSPNIIFAQHLSFENYTTEQGLSQHSCSSIAQDAEGFMWFGTFDGLNRYDGKQFRLFSNNTEKGKKLPSNTITTLYYDSTHNLFWVGTYGGCAIYSASRDSIAAISDFFPFAAVLDKFNIKKIVSF